MISVDDFRFQLAVGQGLVSPGQPADPPRLGLALAAELGWPVVDLADIRVARETLELVPRAFAVHHRLLPLATMIAAVTLAAKESLRRPADLRVGGGQTH